MKNFIKMLTCAGALLALSACSSDSDINPDDNKGRGEETFATFKFNVVSQGTRAESTNTDVNADEVEQKITSVSIYIFDGNVLEKVVTPDLSGVNKTVAVPITTGEKAIYAVTGVLKDGEAAYNVIPEQTKLSDFRQKLISSIPQTDIAVKNKFLMIGQKRVTLTKCTQSYAEANPVFINVTRAAAKVQVKYVKEDVTIRENVNADFSDPNFSVAQIAKQMYVERGSLFTPTGTKVSTGDTGTYPGYTLLNASTNLTWHPGLAEFVPDYESSAYVSENVNEKPVIGNTTFAIVRLKATPKQVYLTSTANGIQYGGTLNADGTFYVLARHEAETGSYIYLSDDDFNLIYFPSNGDASAFMTEKNLAADGYEVYEYKNGEAYYRVNLISDLNEGASTSEKYRVLRNNFYKITVTDIKALGANTAPGLIPSDPDQPLEADSWLAAEIGIEDWEVVEMNNTELQ